MGNIKTGQTVTIDTATGDQGLVYEGEVPFEVKSSFSSPLYFWANSHLSTDERDKRRGVQGD